MKTFVFGLAAAILVAGQLFTPAAAATLSTGQTSEKPGIMALIPSTLSSDQPGGGPDGRQPRGQPGGGGPGSGGSGGGPGGGGPGGGGPGGGGPGGGGPGGGGPGGGGPGGGGPGGGGPGGGGPGQPNQPSNARVSLSTRRAEVGGKVTVYVSGFPANANIDFRLGEKGEDPNVIEDGKTDSDGTASDTLTIPDDANKGEYWVVRVLTTELSSGGADIYSASIYIYK